MEQVLFFLVALILAVVTIPVLSWACADELEQSCQHKSYLDSHPPIDDEEFLRRCRPGVNPEVALKVRQILCDVSGVDYEQIYPEAELVRDLGMY